MGNEPPSPGEANSAEETSCETEDMDDKLTNDKPKRKKTVHWKRKKEKKNLFQYIGLNVSTAGK